LYHDDLDPVAFNLNDRPKKTLHYATPNEAFDCLIAKLARGGETTTHQGVC